MMWNLDATMEPLRQKNNAYMKENVYRDKFQANYIRSHWETLPKHPSSIHVKTIILIYDYDNFRALTESVYHI